MPLRTIISKGGIYIFLYVIVSAISHVSINHATRSIDALISLFYTSLFTIVFFSIINMRELRKNIALIKINKSSILQLNILNAIIWFVAFFSLKVLSPAVFACLFLGAIPISIFILELRKTRVSSRNNFTTAIVLLMLFVLMLLLVFQEIREANSYQILKYGSIVVFIGGIAAAIILKISKHLAIKNMPASLVVSLRFYGVLLISFLLVILNPKQLLVTSKTLAELLIISLVSMALPLFLLQKALKTISPLYASILITIIPILTYFFQIFTGYYEFSAVQFGITMLFTLFLSILAYFKKKDKMATT